MDLHGIVSGAIGKVNPFVSVSVQVSTGYETNAAGRQEPSYAAPVTILAQVQALTYSDLLKLEKMNIQGTRRALYVEGFYAGLIRDKARGGDLLTFPAGTLPEGDVWLIAQVLEAWPDWVKFVITLQNGS